MGGYTAIGFHPTAFLPSHRKSVWFISLYHMETRRKRAKIKPNTSDNGKEHILSSKLSNNTTNTPAILPTLTPCTMGLVLRGK